MALISFLIGFQTGKDIFISDDVEAILAFVDEQTQGFVVQKYIENPLLLDKNRKFDIRWCERYYWLELVTSKELFV